MDKVKKTIKEKNLDIEEIRNNPEKIAKLMDEVDLLGGITKKRKK